MAMLPTGYPVGMSKPAQISELIKLSVEERLQIVEELWDSIADDEESLPVPEEHKRELDRRLADQAANPGVGRPWIEVKKRLLSSR